MLGAGSGEAFNVGRFLEESSPYAWAGTGIGLCIGLSVLGAGWCVYFQMLTCAVSDAQIRAGGSSLRVRVFSGEALELRG